MKMIYAHLRSKIFFISAYKLFLALQLVHFMIAPNNATNRIQTWVGVDLLSVSYTTYICRRMF